MTWRHRHKKNSRICDTKKRRRPTNRRGNKKKGLGDDAEGIRKGKRIKKEAALERDDVDAVANCFLMADTASDARRYLPSEFLFFFFLRFSSTKRN